MKNWVKQLFLVFFLGMVLIPGDVTQAKKTLSDSGAALNTVITPSGITEGDLSVAAAQVVKGIMGIMGLLFFILMVYAGIVWMTAKGEEDRVTKARETIIAAIIGLVITVSAYAITALVVEKVINPTASGGTNSPNANPNTFGGGEGGGKQLACCITPIIKGDVFNYFVIGPMMSVLTPAQCDALAKEKVYGDNYVAEKGKYWDVYPGFTTTQSCAAVLNCWMKVGSDGEKECLDEIIDAQDFNE